MRGVRLLSAVLAFALVASIGVGCGSGTSSAPSPSSKGAPEETAPSGFTKQTPEDTARELTDPKQAEQGVRSLLANLNIGVYTVEGRQVLAGSETGPHDFWVSDQDIPGLARMAGEGPSPFSEFVDGLNGLGVQATAPDLLAAARATYASPADRWLARLFQAMHLDFTGDPKLSPLELWLFFLDAFVPPNGHNPASSTTPAAAGGGALGVRPVAWAADDPCAGVLGNGGPSGWTGWDGSKVVPAIKDPLIVLDVLLLAEHVKTTLEPVASSAEEPPGSPTSAVWKAVVVVEPYVFTTTPNPCIPGGLPVTPSHDGPLGNAPVIWDAPLELTTGRGSVTVEGSGQLFGTTVAVTDSAGTSTATFQAVPGKGAGPLHHELETVTATFDVVPILLQNWTLPPDVVTVVNAMIPSTRIVHAVLDFAFHDCADTTTTTIGPVAFPDGTWSGAALYAGQISQKGMTVGGSGPVTFTLTVQGGQVTAGTMQYGGEWNYDEAGTTGHGQLSANLTLGGSASEVTVTGSVSVTGSADVNGLHIDIPPTSSPAEGSFSPQTVDCNVVTGDLAVHAREAQSAAGFATNVEGPFVARRTD